MACEACTQARAEPTSGLYIAGCTDCAARSIARMQAFFASSREGRMTSSYRMALQNLLPSLPAAEAHEKVKAWTTPTEAASTGGA